MLYFLTRVILLLIFAHLWLFGIGILGLGSWIGFFEVGFLVDWVWACGVRPSGLFSVGALYINIEEKPWEKSLCDGGLVVHIASEIIGVPF